jgi:hypothetical protein
VDIKELELYAESLYKDSLAAVVYLDNGDILHDGETYSRREYVDALREWEERIGATTDYLVSNSAKWGGRFFTEKLFDSEECLGVQPVDAVVQKYFELLETNFVAG